MSSSLFSFIVRGRMTGIQMRFERRSSVAIVAIVFLVLMSGCGPDFRFNGAHNMQDAIETGGDQAYVTITCNRAGAILYAPNGEKLGTCPAKVQLVFDRWSCQAWGPTNMLDFQTRGGNRKNDRYYLSGAVAAPGFATKNFRFLVRSGTRTRGTGLDQTFRVDL